MSIEELFQRAEQAGVDGSFSRIDEAHPVDLFLGLDGGRRAIMVICGAPPPEPPSFGALCVESRRRRDGEWALNVRLDRPDLTVLFSRLVEDLAAATAMRPERPGEVVIQRLVRWQRMLARGGGGLLEDNELRGLIAELSFLLDVAIPAVGVNQSIQAWVGPFDAPKDFVFPDREVEVKATRRQPRSLRISSLEQLTGTDSPLFLWSRVVELEHGLPDKEASCLSWIRRARQVVDECPDSAAALERALRAAGWEDREEYETRRIRLGAMSCYEVKGDFPRIQRPLVSPGVIECGYRISVAALESFVVSSCWCGGKERHGPG
jgi:hypothetical protein